MSRRSNRRNARQRKRPNTAVMESAYSAALDGTMVDTDDYLYRPLTGSRGENLPQFKHDKALAIAKYLFRTNPVGNRFITLLSDFIVGEGVNLGFKNSLVREVCERHWQDTYNDWERFGAERLENFLITGEYLMPLFPNPAGGHLRIGRVVNDNIEAVRTDPDNWEVITHVRMKRQADQLEGRVYTVMNWRENREVLANAANPALFWKRANPFGERGISILYPIADFIDLLDQMAFSEVERWLLMKAFVWDLTIDDADDAAIAKYRQDPAYAGAPATGSVYLHNNKMTLEPKSPKLEAAEAADGMRFLRNHIMGAGGMPEHWYGEGGDVNRAVGAVMAEVPRKRLTRLQDEWRFILRDVLQAQVDYAVLLGTLPEEVPVEDSEGNATDEMVAARDAIEINLPDLAPEDAKDVGATLDVVTRTLALGVSEGYITEGMARRIFLTLATQLGVEINVDEEAERASKEHEEREKEQAEMMPQAMVPPARLAAMPPRGQRNDGQAAAG